MAGTKENKPVSIVQIAQELGISKTTVGYVLSGQAKKRRVSDKTAQLVLDTAKRLNYVPHLWARNLAKQSTGVIGVVVAGYGCNWATQVINGILPKLEEHDYMPMTTIHLWDQKRCSRELRHSLTRRDEGIICQPIPGCREDFELCRNHRVPFLLFADTLDDMPQASFVAWDSVPAAEAAVKHLIETGRRKIGFIGSSLVQLKCNKQRYETYQRVLNETGLLLNPDWIRWSITTEFLRPELASRPNDRCEIRSMLETIFRSGADKPDALFFSHDCVALNVYEHLLDMGIKVPDDVALMGMGDRPIAHDFGVGLSTVREPLEEMGKIAAQSILQLVEEPNSEPIQVLVPSCDIQIRKTTI